MERYRAKPTFVEAVQITDAMIDAKHPSPLHIKGVMYDPVGRGVHVPNGAIGVVGYWIVRGDDGWLTIWSDALFKANYEREK